MTADPEALQRALSAPGLKTTVERTSWGEYPQAVLEALNEWIAGALSGLSLPFAPFSMEMAAWVVVALIVATIVLLLVRALHARWRRTRRLVVRPAVAEAAVPVAPRDAPRWREEAHARLARGDVRGALEAAWWWLATGLAAEVAASRTTREVVLQAGRRDLVPLAQRLDRLTFGAEVPAARDVNALLRSVDGALT